MHFFLFRSPPMMRKVLLKVLKRAHFVWGFWSLWVCVRYEGPIDFFNQLVGPSGGAGEKLFVRGRRCGVARWPACWYLIKPR